jgi:hypothetical protein
MEEARKQCRFYVKELHGKTEKMEGKC